MASKFRGLFWRAKKTKELNPSNNEEQVPESVEEDPYEEVLFAAEKNAAPEKIAAPEKNAAARSVWSPETSVVGKFDFRGKTREDLPFRKGEFLVIKSVTRDPNWYEAVNCNERRGLIPYNFVKELSPVELIPMPWFHGDIRRIEAERLLNPCEDGMFLIRNSGNFKGDYALSVCYANKIEHYRIRTTDDGKLTVDDEVVFESLFEFVEHYSRSADGLCTRLAEPLHSGTSNTGVSRSSFYKGGWEIKRSCLYSKDCIRRGDFGNIFQAEYLDQKVAVKKYSPEIYQDVQAFLIEAAIMTYVKRDIVLL